MASVDSFKLQGLQGGIVLSAGDSIPLGDQKYRWLQVVNDAVLAAFGAPTSQGSALEDPGKLCNITLPAGLGIGGIYMTIEVTSGVVVCYKD